VIVEMENVNNNWDDTVLEDKYVVLEPGRDREEALDNELCMEEEEDEGIALEHYNV
jgi:hypothetical protein